MIKIAHKREGMALNNLPVEVIEKVVEITTILDKNYGETRHTEHDLGGYILIEEVQEDKETIKKP